MNEENYNEPEHGTCKICLQRFDDPQSDVCEFCDIKKIEEEKEKFSL